MHDHGRQLNDESLQTLMVEAECIVYSRLLTTDETTCKETPDVLTPNHLLTQKSQVVLPPPAVFQRADPYSRKHWRRVQHLANEFWQRWRKSFLQSNMPQKSPSRRCCHPKRRQLTQEPLETGLCRSDLLGRRWPSQESTHCNS